MTWRDAKNVSGEWPDSAMADAEDEDGAGEKKENF